MSKGLLPDSSENKTKRELGNDPFQHIASHGAPEFLYHLVSQIMLTCLSFVERTDFFSSDMKNLIFFEN